MPRFTRITRQFSRPFSLIPDQNRFPDSLISTRCRRSPRTPARHVDASTRQWLFINVAVRGTPLLPLFHSSSSSVSRDILFHFHADSLFKSISFVFFRPFVQDPTRRRRSWCAPASRIIFPRNSFNLSVYPSNPWKPRWRYYRVKRKERAVGDQSTPLHRRGAAIVAIGRLTGFRMGKR